MVFATANNPAMLDWTGPFLSDTIRRQPSADPVQKQDPGSGMAQKKGLTTGPLQKLPLLLNLNSNQYLPLTFSTILSNF